jgi:hypothetical protein
MSASGLPVPIGSELRFSARLEKQVVRSRVCEWRGVEAVWNETLLMDASRCGHQADLELELWGEACGALGRLRLPVPLLRQARTFEDSLPLRPYTSPHPHVPAAPDPPRSSLGSVRLAVEWLAASPTARLSRDDFELLRVLGRGSFGKVLLVRRRTSGRLYAMKVVRKERVIRAGAVRHALAERRALSRVASHPFIVGLKFAFQTSAKLYLVLDACLGGELFFHLSRVERFEEPRARFYAAEIASALGFLHANRILYRDLKPENLLLDLDGHLLVRLPLAPLLLYFFF